MKRRTKKRMMRKRRKSGQKAKRTRNGARAEIGSDVREVEVDLDGVEVTGLRCQVPFLECHMVCPDIQSLMERAPGVHIHRPINLPVALLVTTAKLVVP